MSLRFTKHFISCVFIFFEIIYRKSRYQNDTKLSTPSSAKRKGDLRNVFEFYCVPLILVHSYSLRIICRKSRYQNDTKLFPPSSVKRKRDLRNVFEFYCVPLILVHSYSWSLSFTFYSIDYSFFFYIEIIVFIYIIYEIIEDR